MFKNNIRRTIFISLLITISILFSSCKFENISNKKIKDIEYTVLPENEIPEEIVELIEQKKISEFKIAYSDPENTYILIGYGEQNYQGYTIEVEKVYETENTVNVKTTFNGPKEYTNVQSKSYPYIVLKIESTSKNVIFDN